jgi:hypothetical protein
MLRAFLGYPHISQINWEYHDPSVDRRSAPCPRSQFPQKG